MPSKLVTIKGTPHIPAYLAAPLGQPVGAVIVIHEVWGLVDHIKSVADRLASAGYLALAPDLLSIANVNVVEARKLQEALFDPKRRNEVQPRLRELMTPMQDPKFGEQTIKRLQSCFDYLYDLPESNKKVAVMGFCFGGTYSFKLATLEPRLLAAIPFYGHSEDGAEAFKKISCPVLAFFGENDERLIAQLPTLEANMKQAGVDFKYKVYPDCGHAFFNDSNKFAYNQAAAQDAWQQSLALLKRVSR